MSDKTAQPMMTNVKGYFNPNTYRVNVAISELGISVQLDPQEFIVERGTNRKINDPILDRYVGYKMLSPELSNAPVPVVPIPRMPAPQPSLHVVNQGVRDGTGKWTLPAPGSKPEQSLVQVPPTVTKPSTVGMSIEEARRRGFIGKVRLVDEDYGAAETDGAPTRGDAIPNIKYAMESRAPLAQPGQLPPEVMESVRPDVAPIIAGLQKAAQSNPETVNLGRKAAEQAVAAQQGEQGVKAFRAEVKQVKAKQKQAMPKATVPPPPAAAPTPAPRRRIAQVVTEATPVVPAASPMPVVAESPLVGGRPDLPQPQLDEVAEAPVEAAPAPVAEATEKPQPGEAKQPIRCGACGKEFPYMSYYKRHVLRAHKDRITELLPQQ